MKTLIAYFSWSGNTERIVEGVNKQFNFDGIAARIPFKRFGTPQEVANVALICRN